MSQYDEVQATLDAGVSPAIICETCPWDRSCVNPPQSTSQDIERRKREAEERDAKAEAEALAKGEKPPLPMGSLLTTIMDTGAELQMKACPVLILRYRSPEGRDIHDSIRKTMQSWPEDNVPNNGETT